MSVKTYSLNGLSLDPGPVIFAAAADDAAISYGSISSVSEIQSGIVVAGNRAHGVLVPVSDQGAGAPAGYLIAITAEPVNEGDTVTVTYDGSTITPDSNGTYLIYLGGTPALNIPIVATTEHRSASLGLMGCYLEPTNKLLIFGFSLADPEESLEDGRKVKDICNMSYNSGTGTVSGMAQIIDYPYVNPRLHAERFVPFHLGVPSCYKNIKIRSHSGSPEFAEVDFHELYDYNGLHMIQAYGSSRFYLSAERSNGTEVTAQVNNSGFSWAAIASGAYFSGVIDEESTVFNNKAKNYAENVEIWQSSDDPVEFTLKADVVHRIGSAAPRIPLAYILPATYHTLTSYDKDGNVLGTYNIRNGGSVLVTIDDVETELVLTLNDVQVGVIKIDPSTVIEEPETSSGKGLLLGAPKSYDGDTVHEATEEET
jgi:hypothetical protein